MVLAAGDGGVDDAGEIHCGGGVCVTRFGDGGGEDEKEEEEGGG